MPRGSSSHTRPLTDVAKVSMHIDKSVKPAQIINNLRVTHGLHISYQYAYRITQKVMNKDILSQRDQFTKFESYGWKLKEINPDTSAFLKFNIVDGFQKFNSFFICPGPASFSICCLL